MQLHKMVIEFYVSQACSTTQDVHQQKANAKKQCCPYLEIGAVRSLKRATNRHRAYASTNIENKFASQCVVRGLAENNLSTTSKSQNHRLTRRVQLGMWLNLLTARGAGSSGAAAMRAAQLAFEFDRNESCRASWDNSGLASDSPPSSL